MPCRCHCDLTRFEGTRVHVDGNYDGKYFPHLCAVETENGVSIRLIGNGCMRSDTHSVPWSPVAPHVANSSDNAEGAPWAYQVPRDATRERAEKISLGLALINLPVSGGQLVQSRAEAVTTPRPPRCEVSFRTLRGLPHRSMRRAWLMSPPRHRHLQPNL